MANYVDRRLNAKLILPFAAAANDRIKTFTKDMEMAAILYLAESDREKGEGLIFKKPDEKLVFVAEACYPIWLVPWNRETLAFDGLGATTHTLSYDKLPDTETFNNDIQRSTKTFESYSAALSRNANYFQSFAGKEEKTIEGLIASPEFTQDLSAYLSKIKETENPLATAVLSPAFDESRISASIEELSDLRAKIDEDIESIDNGAKLLNMSTREKARATREQIKEIRKHLGKQIERAKPRVSRRIRQIQEIYGKKISRTSRQLDRRLQLLNKDRVKINKMQRHLTTEMKRCEARTKSTRRRKNKRNETRWSLRLERIKKRLPTLKKNIKDIDENISTLETTKKLRVTQQRLECDNRREKTTKLLRDLEASRDAQITMKRQQIKSLEEATSQITTQMNEMTKSKKAELNKVDRINMPKRNGKVALVHVPFYLARYEKEGKQRYTIYPPCTVSDMGILTKMKGALGAAKMKTLLQPRSKALTAFLNQFITILQTNPMLEKEVTEAGIQDSILRTRELRIGVKRGLMELEQETWISEKDLQNFSELLYVYA